MDIKIKIQLLCKFNNHKIITKKIIFCTNGFLKSLGVKKNYNFPLTLTASMTRSLTDTVNLNLLENQKNGVCYLLDQWEQLLE